MGLSWFLGCFIGVLSQKQVVKEVFGLKKKSIAHDFPTTIVVGIWAKQATRCLPQQTTRCLPQQATRLLLMASRRVCINFFICYIFLTIKIYRKNIDIYFL
jgi:hypothetical protein